MILFTILAIIAVLLIVITIAIVSAIGAAGIVVFGDVIVCIALIVGVMYLLIRRKRK